MDVKEHNSHELAPSKTKIFHKFNDYLDMTNISFTIRCKTMWSKIAYFCYEAHQRKTYDGCLRAQRQIISYTWGCGLYRGPLGASAG